MPDETRAIEPALDEKQWSYATREVAQARKDAADFEVDADIRVVEKIGEHIVASYLENPRRSSIDTMVSVMALANAALPVDDPRKITREDVEWANEAVELAKYVQEREWVWGEKIKGLESLAAKLAALLPPEG